MADCVNLTITDDFSDDDVTKPTAATAGGGAALFDQTIGHLQSILLEEKFSEVQGEFLEEHCHHFEDTEENKFIYTDIFKRYTDLVESHLERELQARMPGFSIHTFLESLDARKDEVGEEIFDLLLSFSDFLSFKQTMLSYRAAKEGVSLDLGGLIITPLSPKR